MQMHTEMLRFEQISRRYPQAGGSMLALQDINASIAPGQIVALSGPSGSGKSTLLNICGLIDCDYDGALYFQGERMPKDPQLLTARRRQQLGFIFQRYNLIDVMTAFENVEYPLLLAKVPSLQRRELVLEMLAQVGLTGFEQQRPLQLSGGQQQRVAIARALVKKPALVIADEPTANLDSVTAGLVIDLMRRLGHQQQTTFLIATHDERMISRCDSALLLSDGRLLTPDSSASLRKTAGKATVSVAEVS